MTDAERKKLLMERWIAYCEKHGYQSLKELSLLPMYVKAKPKEKKK